MPGKHEKIDDKKTGKLMNINITNKGRLLALFYAIVYTALAAWLAFFNIYLDEYGYTGAQIGLINGLLQATLIIVVPLWGYLADKNGNVRMLTLSLVVSAILVFALQFMEHFVILTAFVLFVSLFLHPLGPLTDSLIVDYVKINQRLSFGALRMWGSIGWGVTTIVMGYVLMVTGTKIIFSVSAALMLVLVVILHIYARGIHPIRQKPTRPADMIRMLKETNLTPLFVIICLYGISISPTYLFINLYFKEIGASHSFIGWAFTIQAFSEIPFFFFGTLLARRYGIKTTLLAAMSIAFIRLVLYGYISNPFIAVWIGVLQGVTLSFFLVAVVEYVHNRVPQQWRATAQSLIWCFHFGLGFSIGNVFVGYFKDQIQMQGVMKGAAVFCVLVTMATWYYFNRYNHRKKVMS
jgi:MFS transporter, PPP family, 3-phenylpropionic acid transporter